MNIKEFLQKKESINIYAGSFKRSSATMIDMLIVLVLRTVIMQIMAFLWINQQILEFAAEFKNRFGTESMKNTPEHMDFFLHHKIIIYTLIFYFITLLVGAFYHAYLNSSKWQATIGKRLMKIIMIKEDEAESSEKITFKTASAHYFLSITPFIFIIYLIFYQVKHELSFIQTITASEMNVFLGIIFVLWVQIHLFTKKKTTAYDMICKTNFINGRTKNKFPW
jgi:uncharacterized RDD family membrane protein YckC